MANGPLMLFALDASRQLGLAVSAALGHPLAAHEEREFEDGEHKARSLISVRGADVYVLHSLYGDADQSVNDKLLRLVFFIGALRDASAARITAIVPYLAYARKDRRSQPRDPVTTRYVAQLLEAVGTDRVVTLDVHNPAAFQNAFRCGTEHLEANELFVGHLVARLGDHAVVVVSPDAGGIKRAEALRRRLADRLRRPVGAAFAEKHRSGGVVSGEAFVGDVEGKAAIIVDDLISAGATLARAAQACAARGAREIHALATHAVFAPAVSETLGGSAIDYVVVTDTIAPWRTLGASLEDKLVRLSTAALWAQAIRRLHEDGSIAELAGG
jgi:ribose-phosphate pyrophosphokinase